MAPLPDDVPYYVTLDIDAIDPVYAPGTNSPVPGGFSHAEIFQLLTKILPGKRIVGCDLVEIDPRKDQGNCTVQIGLELLLFMLSLMVPEAETASGSMG